MIVKRTSTFAGGEVDVGALDTQLSQLFKAASLVSPGVPSTGRACDNLDAVWVIHTFGAAPNTDETIPHKLGRAPVGLFNVELPALAAGTAPVVGTVTFGSIPPTASLVTLRCNAASKRAAVILF